MNWLVLSPSTAEIRDLIRQWNYWGFCKECIRRYEQKTGYEFYYPYL